MPKADRQHTSTPPTHTTHEGGTPPGRLPPLAAPGSNLLALAMLKADMERRLDSLESIEEAISRAFRMTDATVAAWRDDEARMRRLIMASPAANLQDAVVQVHTALFELWTAESCANAGDMLPPIMDALRSALGALAPAAGINLADLGEMPPSSAELEAVA